MKRVWATAGLAAIGLFGSFGRGEDPLWKPGNATTPQTAPPVPVATPAAPAVVFAPTPSPASTTVPATTAAKPPEPTANGAIQELSQWLPARRYPTDFPPKQPTTPAAAPTPTPVMAPPAAPADSVTVFRPASTTLPTDPPATLPAVQPAPATAAAPAMPPRAAEPPPLPTLPTIQSVPVSVVTEQSPIPAPPVPALPDVKPADPPKPASEKLPPPKAADTPKVAEPPKVSDPPRSLPAAPNRLPIDCPPPSGPALDPPPGGVVLAGDSSVPVRKRVFGSPSINLSRDYYFRDLLGLDLHVTTPSPVGAEDFGAAGDSLFVQAEYLLWWTKKPQIPVLATTSAGGGGLGFLGDADTRNLLGPGGFGSGLHSGFRIRAGGALDECGLLGIDGSFFFLGRTGETAAFGSDQFPVITRPFFAPNFNAEFGEVVARPGVSSGRLEAASDTFLWGADVNVRRAICRTCDGSRGWLFGYRHLNLTDRLSVTEFLTATGTQSGDPVGTQVVVGDRFETRNRFHGGQLGYFWTRQYGRLDVDVRASVALGVTNSTVDIDGFQERTRPGEATQRFTGGLLAVGSNIGTFKRSAFSVVPELTTNLGFFATPNLKVYVGYNFLFWSNVLRPGDQIDRVIDVTLVPNPPAGVAPSGQNRPLPTFARSDFWAQGVQFGLEFRW